MRIRRLMIGNLIILFTGLMLFEAKAVGVISEQSPPRLALSDGEIALGYTLYWGGLHMAEIEILVKIGAENYEIDFISKTVGVLAWIMEAESRIKASGFLQLDGAISAREMALEGQFKGEAHRLHVQFDAQGIATDVEIWHEEGFDPEMRETVPLKLQHGPDPVSLLLALGHSPQGKLRQGKRIFTSFDGKRALEIILDCRSDLTILEPSSYSAYHGAAIICTATGEQKAGFHKKYRKNNVQLDRPAQIWMVPLMGSSYYLPARLSMETQYGSIVAHLSRLQPEFLKAQ